MSSIRPPLSKRRTVAIISHPDAGKTTLTEKFLLYGGAIEQAGSVTARRRQRTTASDWMAMEQQRGISISSTVLQFDYDGYRINLLDTPGHEDFSEDTYRVLRSGSAAKAKRFRAGLAQMVSEGVVQLYGLASGPATAPLLAAVGPLQFEVLKDRIENEYGAEVVVEGRPWKLVRWLTIGGREPESGEIAALTPPSGCAFARDPAGRWTLLAEGEWAYQVATRYQRDWTLTESPPPASQALP